MKVSGCFEKNQTPTICKIEISMCMIFIFFRDSYLDYRGTQKCSTYLGDIWDVYKFYHLNYIKIQNKYTFDKFNVGNFI